MTNSAGSVTTLGRFEILRELGRGAFGIVYLARDPQLETFGSAQVTERPPQGQSWI